VKKETQVLCENQTLTILLPHFKHVQTSFYLLSTGEHV